MSRDNVMWNGTCQHLDFAGQLEATRRSGCNILTITPLHFKQRVAAGLFASDMRHMAEDSGVRLSHLDPLCTWAPKWRPNNVPESFFPFFDTSVDDFLRIAEELRCESLTAICTFPLGEVAVDALIEPFARLCERAGGLRVDLEFIPIWGLPDIASAWTIVETAGMANGGIMLDFWHFFRGKPDFDVLQAIPSEKIHAVQACDAMSRIGAGRTELQDILNDRLPLGWGEFDIDRILDVLHQKSALNRIGPEYYSDKMAGLSPAGVADIINETYWSKVSPLGVTRAA